MPIGRRQFAAMLAMACSVAVSLLMIRPADAAVPTLFQEVRGSAVVTNTAVTASAFALSYFHVPYNIARLAASLGAGSSWERRGSLGRIGTVLKDHGLRPRIYSGERVSFAAIAAQLARHRGKEVAMVCLKDLHVVGAETRCYVALTGRTPHSMYAMALGIFSGVWSVRHLDQGLGTHLGRICFFIRAATTARTPVYLLSRKKPIRLTPGFVAGGPGMLQIPFLLRNTAHKDISVAFARGTCFYFKGAKIATPNGRIAPGGVGRVLLTFSRSEIGIGPVTREAIILFNGYPGRPLHVIVHCDVLTGQVAAQLTWYPQAIDLGVVRGRKTPADQEFTVLTPRGVALNAPRASSKAIRVIRLAVPGGKPQVDRSGRTAHEFVIDFSRLPFGPVNLDVTLGTTDKYVPNIVIPITGQVQR